MPLVSPLLSGLVSFVQWLVFVAGVRQQLPVASQRLEVHLAAAVTAVDLVVERAHCPALRLASEPGLLSQTGDGLEVVAACRFGHTVT